MYCILRRYTVNFYDKIKKYLEYIEFRLKFYVKNGKI
jgi:hypothetical protein